MKNSIYIALLISVFMTSCNKEDYTGEIIEDDPSIFEIEPMPVLINLGDSQYELSTKGYGTFNNLAEKEKIDSVIWKNAIFYVYSFCKGEECDMTINWADEENNNGNICLIDASRNDTITDEIAQKGGKSARFNTSDFKLLEWAMNPDSVVYYNTADYYKSYNFFVYHLDDSHVSDIDRQKDRIAIDLEIDGSQDLMAGKAELTESQNALINSKELGNDLKENYYSTFSANHEINPYVTLQHYLAKFRFELYPGGDLKENRDSSACFEAYVKEININSLSKAKMTVASNNEDIWPLGVEFDNNSSKYFPLRDRYLDEEGQLQDSTQFHQRLVYNESDVVVENVYMRKPQPIGDDLLISPSEQVEIRMIMVNDRNEEFEGQEPFTLTLVPPEGETSFKAGKSYVVKLAIYGYQQIEANVDIVAWKDGGIEEIDPDMELNGYDY